MSPSVLHHSVAVSAFMIYRGLCACTEMVWMCVLYVSLGSKVRPRTFGCETNDMHPNGTRDQFNCANKLMCVILK